MKPIAKPIYVELRGFKLFFFFCHLSRINDAGPLFRIVWLLAHTEVIHKNSSWDAPAEWDPHARLELFSEDLPLPLFAVTHLRHV